MLHIPIITIETLKCGSSNNNPIIGTIYKIPTFYTIFYERRIFDYKSCYIGNIGSSSIIRLDENGEQVLFV